jgi:hypothetical protein
MVVQFCGGEASTKVKGVRPEERLTPEKAQAVGRRLRDVAPERGQHSP